MRKSQPRWPIVHWLGIVYRASALLGGQVPISGLEILLYLYNSDNLGTKTVISRVETSPHDVETPVPPADRRSAGDRTENQCAPGRISSHPRITNPSIHLQLQLPGDENEDPPGRYRRAGCGNPNPSGWLLIGWCIWCQRAARVTPLANVEVPPRPRRIRFYLRMRTHSIPLQLQQPGDEKRDRLVRYRPARCGNPNPTG